MSDFEVVLRTRSTLARELVAEGLLQGPQAMGEVLVAGVLDDESPEGEVARNFGATLDRIAGTRAEGEVGRSIEVQAAGAVAIVDICAGAGIPVVWQ